MEEMSVKLVKQPKSELSQLLELLESGGAGENKVGETSKVSDSLPSTRSPPSQRQQRSISEKVGRSERKRRQSDQSTDNEQPTKRRAPVEGAPVTADGEAALPDGYHHLVYVRAVRVQTSSRRTGFRSDEPTVVQVEALGRVVPSARQLGHVDQAPDDERDFRPVLASTQATYPPEESPQTPDTSLRPPTTTNRVAPFLLLPPSPPPSSSSSLRNLIVPADLIRECRQIVAACLL